MTALARRAATRLRTAALLAGGALIGTLAAAELLPLPTADLSGLEPLGREAIQTARARLGEGEGRAALAERYARLGALYQRFDIDRAAAVCWSNARRLQPDDYRWPYYQGWLALNLGQLDQALAAFKRARELRPDFPPLDLRIGQVMLGANRLEEASAHLRRAAESPGLRAAALYYQGQIAVLRRDYPSAEPLLAEALRLAPDAAAVHYPLAQAYRGLGEPERARAELALFRGHSAADTPAVEDPLADRLQQVIQRSDEAFNDAMAAVRARAYPAAVSAFEKGLAIDPDNLDARISYARALYLADRVEQARGQLQRVLDSTQGAPHDGANPRRALAAFLLGLLADERPDPADARRLYRLALSLQADQAGAHYFLAHHLFRDGRYRDAAAHYRAAYADTDLPPARLLGLVAERLAGDLDATIAAELVELLDAAAAAPQRSAASYALARLRALSDDPAVHDDVAAVELANALVQRQPRPLHLELLALAAAANGQYDTATEILEHVAQIPAWQRDPGSPARVDRDLAAYRAHRLAGQPAWPADDPLLAPPPFDASAPFREYLTPTPF